jgi:hypothetical protein
MAADHAQDYAPPPARVFERVSRYVETHPGADAGEVRLAVPAIGGVTDVALARLTRAGFLELRDGRYRSFKPVRRAA